MIILKKLRTFDVQSLRDINSLLSQLSSSSKKVSQTDLKRILGDKNTRLFVLQDQKTIAGMGTVVFILTPVGLRARMEDLVIDEKYRRRGLGTKLIRKMVIEAKSRKALWVEFTSRADRVIANRFYRLLGFKKYNTNVYRLWLKKN